MFAVFMGTLSVSLMTRQKVFSGKGLLQSNTVMDECKPHKNVMNTVCGLLCSHFFCFKPQ